MNRTVKLTKRVQTSRGLRYCPVVLSANGRVRADLVIILGQEERHPEGASSWVSRADVQAHPSLPGRSKDRRDEQGTDALHQFSPSLIVSQRCDAVGLPKSQPVGRSAHLETGTAVTGNPVVLDGDVLHGRWIGGKFKCPGSLSGSKWKRE
jgi:hypothetical protein